MRSLDSFYGVCTLPLQIYHSILYGILLLCLCQCSQQLLGYVWKAVALMVLDSLLILKPFFICEIWPFYVYLVVLTLKELYWSRSTCYLYSSFVQVRIISMPRVSLFVQPGGGIFYLKSVFFLLIFKLIRSLELIGLFHFQTL